MKKLVVAMGILTLGLYATDFSQMTMDVLNALRGAVSADERDAFKTEMQSRLQAMTPEERQTYISERRNSAGTGSGQGSMQRLRDGSGGGMMRRGGGGRR